jgi:hypothetical protein
MLCLIKELKSHNVTRDFSVIIMVSGGFSMFE